MDPDELLRQPADLLGSADFYIYIYIFFFFFFWGGGGGNRKKREINLASSEQRLHVAQCAHNFYTCKTVHE